MAFATMDPKKAEALRLAAEREIADIRAREEYEARVRTEIETCYGAYAPAQIRHKVAMIHNHHNAARKANHEAEMGIACWERIGRSRGGRKKGNLYKCLVK